MSFDNFDLIRLFTSLQLVLLCLALLVINSGRKQRSVLALFLLAQGLFIFSGVHARLFNSFEEKNLLFILHIVFSFGYLIGPAIYIYITSIVSGEIKYRRVFLIHFVPFYIMLIANIIILHIPGSDIFQLDKNLDTNIFQKAAFTFLHLHILAYVVLSISSLIKYERKNNGVKSARKSARQLNWMRYLTYSFLVIWILESLVHFTYSYFLYYLCEIKIVLAGIHFTLANSIVIIGLKQPELFNNQEKRRYEKNQLKENVKNGLLAKLEHYMTIESPYLDPELKFKDVAGKLNISTHQLSQLLNTSLNLNFYEYINSYRIEEAKSILTSSDSSDKTIMEIMYDVGFSSKSAFNAAFKQYTGVTPSAFRKQNIL